MLHRINLFIFFSVIFNYGTYGQGFEVKSINTISTTDDPRDAFIVDLDRDGDQDVIAAVFQWNDIIWYKNDWDGTDKKGRPLPSGPYLYIIDRGDESYVKEGWLYIFY